MITRWFGRLRGALARPVSIQKDRDYSLAAVWALIGFYVAFYGAASTLKYFCFAYDDFDLAGFCVGVVEKDRIIEGSRVAAGDVLLGLASSGLHSNGFSLVRKIIASRQTDLQLPLADSTLGEILLTPTRIYVQPLLSLLQQCEVHAIAHITGGGITENIPRILGDGLSARVDTSSWKQSPLFDWLQASGRIETDEMRRTFNCGVGMVVILAPAKADAAMQLLKEHGIESWVIGEIRDGDRQVDMGL